MGATGKLVVVGTAVVAVVARKCVVLVAIGKLAVMVVAVDDKSNVEVDDGT